MITGPGSLEWCPKRLDDPRPITADDRFSIGSLSKLYTAALILQVVDGGELSLADSVEQSPLIPERQAAGIGHPGSRRMTLGSVTLGNSD